MKFNDAERLALQLTKALQKQGAAVILGPALTTHPTRPRHHGFQFAWQIAGSGGYYFLLAWIGEQPLPIVIVDFFGPFDSISDMEEHATDDSPLWSHGTDDVKYLAERMVEEMGDSAPASAAPSAAFDQRDVDTINQHRRSIGGEPIDLSAGWSVEEIREMAENIRTQGRTHNPKLKRRLMR